MKGFNYPGYKWNDMICRIARNGAVISTEERTLHIHPLDKMVLSGTDGDGHKLYKRTSYVKESGDTLEFGIQSYRHESVNAFGEHSMTLIEQDDYYVPLSSILWLRIHRGVLDANGKECTTSYSSDKFMEYGKVR